MQGLRGPAFASKRSANYAHRGQLRLTQVDTIVRSSICSLRLPVALHRLSYVIWRYHRRSYRTYIHSLPVDILLILSIRRCGGLRKNHSKTAPTPSGDFRIEGGSHSSACSLEAFSLPSPALLAFPPPAARCALPAATCTVCHALAYMPSAFPAYILPMLSFRHALCHTLMIMIL